MISANTLFHFTPQFDYLESMLKGKIRPRYNMEYFPFIKDNRLGYVAIPMICFCDLPLSEITNHTNNYGEFAIGMSKEWAQKNRITPIQYVAYNANIANYIDNQIAINRNNKSIAPPSPNNTQPIMPADFHDIVYPVKHIIEYLKPVKGRMWNTNALGGKPIYFYDEREWRYVPDICLNFKTGQLIFMDKSSFIDQNYRNQMNNIAKTFSVKYGIDDIKYIIMPQRSIKPFERLIDRPQYVFNSYKTELLSKIITIEQIKEDV
jgi:hypothetical protein